MGLAQYKAKVAEKKVFNNKYCLVHLELLNPHRIEFVAGQHVKLTLPESGEKRNYSIASIPEMDHAVELLVDVGPGGLGSSFLSEAEFGVEVLFEGPIGEFQVAESNSEKELVFVAAGSGISPIRSMVLDLLESRKDKRKIKLHWGLRLVEDMFWEEDFYELAKEHDGFEVDIVLSEQPVPEWKLCSGKVSDCLVNHRSEFDETGYYLCGNREMVGGVVKLLEEKGVNRELIHMQKFY